MTTKIGFGAQRVFATTRLMMRMVLVALLTMTLSIGGALPLGQVSGGVVTPKVAYAQGRQILRDSETEMLLRDMAAPIFEVAGLSRNAVRLGIIQDPSLNAFVTQGLNMFFHTGLLLEAKTPEEVIGVIAHETGHIAGGHLIRLRENIRSASTQAILATILGIAGALASGRGEVGAAIISGGQQIAGRSFLSFSRAQEASADAAGIAFLEESGQTAHGFLRFMERLGEQDLLPANRQVEYARTHPLTRNRVDAIRAHLDRKDVGEALAPDDIQERFDRMQAKLLAYITPRVAFQRYPSSDNSITAQYGRTVALWRTGDLRGATRTLRGLIEQEPDNPYFYELLGQIELEAGNINDAIDAYAVAAGMLPNSALTQVAYGHALTQRSEPEDLMNAREVLLLALQKERSSPRTHRLLAVAYGRLGEEGPARLHLAEEALLQRNLDSAKANLTRAREAIEENDRQNQIRLADLENQLELIEADQDE